MRILQTKKEGFSIRQKMMLVVLVSVILLASTLYGISVTVLPQSYAHIEQADLLKDLGRANDAIGNIYTLYNEKLVDWAAWDDTYKFVVDLNKNYLESDLNDSNLVHLNINAMVFANADGHVVFHRAIDLVTGNEVPSDDIAQYIESHKDLVTHSSTDSRIYGLLPLSGGPFLFVSQPILTSNGDGPIHGSLIFGKYLNKSVIDSVANLTHLSVQAFAFGSATSPADVVNAERLITGDADHTTTALSDSTIAAYKLLRDYYGNPLLTLRVEVPRDVYSQGRYTSSFLTIGASVLICIFGVILIVLLERFVVSRFTRLSESLMAIAGQRDTAARVPVESKDEIGELAISIDDLLDRLVASDDAEKRSTGKMRVVNDQLEMRLGEIKKLSAAIADKDEKIAELTKEIAKLKK